MFVKNRTMFLFLGVSPLGHHPALCYSLDIGFGNYAGAVKAWCALCWMFVWFWRCPKHSSDFVEVTTWF